jgi:hypothetical protein
MACLAGRHVVPGPGSGARSRGHAGRPLPGRALLGAGAPQTGTWPPGPDLTPPGEWSADRPPHGTVPGRPQGAESPGHTLSGSPVPAGRGAGAGQGRRPGGVVLDGLDGCVMGGWSRVPPFRSHYGNRVPGPLFHAAGQPNPAGPVTRDPPEENSRLPQRDRQPRPPGTTSRINRHHPLAADEDSRLRALAGSRISRCMRPWDVAPLTR